MGEFLMAIFTFLETVLSWFIDVLSFAGGKSAKAIRHAIENDMKIPLHRVEIIEILSPSEIVIFHLLGRNMLWRQITLPPARIAFAMKWIAKHEKKIRIRI